jgi:ferredoxin
MKITIDVDKCIGAGNCVMWSPEVFDQRDEDGIVVVMDEMPDQALWESVRTAAAACPANVILLED